jgi:hypothetical protein
MSLLDRLRRATTTAGRDRSVADLSAEAPSAAAAVPTTWLAAPTLAESNTERRVAGTSFHQDLLASAARTTRSASPYVDLLTVQLAVVETGEHAGAIGVYLSGRRAGSLPAEHVEAYRPVVAGLTEQGRPATCRAAILGGREMRDGDGMLRFGLALLQPGRPVAAGLDAPFLPPHVGMRVVVDGQTAARLDAALPSRAKRFVHRRTGVLTPDGLLSLDGDVLGRLERGREVLEPVRAAHAAGFPLTCAVRLIREPDRPLRVAADLPMSDAS